jgi:hypothetical protein
MIMFHGLFTSTDLLIWDIQVFLPTRLASLRSRNRKAYAVVRNCPYIRAPVSRSTKCVSLPVKPCSRPDYRYARRANWQIYVWITYLLELREKWMLAFTGTQDRGLVPTLGVGVFQVVEISRVRALLNLSLFVAKRDSAHTSLPVSDCTVTTIRSKQKHVPKLPATALNWANICFWSYTIRWYAS